MTRRRFLGYSLLLVVSALAIVIALYAASKRNAVQLSLYTTAEPVPSDSTATQASLETISAEHTAIAVFTQNPTLTLSSTPFYAEIIANDIIRKMDAHEWPYGQQSVPTYDFSGIIESQLETIYGITWTPTATFTPLAVVPTVTPVLTVIPKHVPVVATVVLEISQKLTDLLHGKGIQGTGAVTSTGVECIDAACTIRFVPIYTRFGFFIYSEISSQEIGKVLEQVLEVFAGFEPQNTDISRIRCTVDFDFGKSDGSNPEVAVQTDCQTAISKYREGLKGQDLLNALGGLVRYDLEATTTATP